MLKWLQGQFRLLRGEIAEPTEQKTEMQEQMEWKSQFFAGYDRIAGAYLRGEVGESRYAEHRIALTTLTCGVDHPRVLGMRQAVRDWEGRERAAAESAPGDFANLPPATSRRLRGLQPRG